MIILDKETFTKEDHNKSTSIKVINKNLNNTSGMTISSVFFVIFLVILLNLIIIFICRRYSQYKINKRLENQFINDQISSVVDRYIKMKENVN